MVHFCSEFLALMASKHCSCLLLPVAIAPSSALHAHPRARVAGEPTGQGHRQGLEAPPWFVFAPT